MAKAIVWGLAAGAGFQAWRNYPPDGPSTALGLWLLLVVGLVAAYVSGFGSALFWFRGGRASAHASAHAAASAQAAAAARSASTSSSSVNVAVVIPGGGGAGAGVASLPWFEGPKPEVTSDSFDGMDVVEAGLVDEVESVEVSR